MFVTYTSEDGSHSECYVVNDPVPMKSRLSKSSVLYQLKMHGIKYCEPCMDKNIPTILTDYEVEQCVKKYENELETKYECGECGGYDA